MGARAAVLLLALLQGAGVALALEPPKLTRRVTDLAGVLRPDDVNRMEETLRAYEQQTGHQFAVLVLPSLEGDVIEPFAIRVAEQWKLGDTKRDDGLLMVVAVKDRKMRIEVGYGLEGVIPDVVASRVIRERMTPRFREGDYAGGISSALDALMKAAQGESLGPPQQRDDGNGKSTPFAPLAILMVLFGIFQGLPRPIRMVAGGVIGAGAGLMMGSVLWALPGLVVGALVGGILGGRRGGFFFIPGGFGGGRSRGGGFSGGGGGFGGGGASGDW